MSALLKSLLTPWRRPRIGLAFSSRLLLAIRPEDPGRVLTREVSPGLLAPSAVVPNIQSMRELAQLASEMIDELDGRGATAAVLLPDLAVVNALLPASRGASPYDIAAEVGPRLGFPVSEARMDFWRGRKGEILAAAVREAVVRQYEQVVEAAECRLGWMDAASLTRIPEWAEAASPEGVTSVRVQLYSSHYVIAMFRGGELVDVRTRLRAGDDSEELANEILRLPALYGISLLNAVALSGTGASTCARHLENAEALGGIVSVEESEESQLEASLRAVLKRN